VESRIGAGIPRVVSVGATLPHGHAAVPNAVQAGLEGQRLLRLATEATEATSVHQRLVVPARATASNAVAATAAAGPTIATTSTDPTPPLPQAYPTVDSRSSLPGTPSASPTLPQPTLPPVDVPPPLPPPSRTSIAAITRARARSGSSVPQIHPSSQTQAPVPPPSPQPESREPRKGAFVSNRRQPFSRQHKSTGPAAAPAQRTPVPRPDPEPAAPEAVPVSVCTFSLAGLSGGAGGTGAAAAGGSSGTGAAGVAGGVSAAGGWVASAAYAAAAAGSAAAADLTAITASDRTLANFCRSMHVCLIQDARGPAADALAHALVHTHTVSPQAAATSSGSLLSATVARIARYVAPSPGLCIAYSTSSGWSDEDLAPAAATAAASASFGTAVAAVGPKYPPTSRPSPHLDFTPIPLTVPAARTFSAPPVIAVKRGVRAVLLDASRAWGPRRKLLCFNVQVDGDQARRHSQLREAAAFIHEVLMSLSSLPPSSSASQDDALAAPPSTAVEDDEDAADFDMLDELAPTSPRPQPTDGGAASATSSGDSSPDAATAPGTSTAADGSWIDAPQAQALPDLFVHARHLSQFRATCRDTAVLVCGDAADRESLLLDPAAASFAAAFPGRHSRRWALLHRGDALFPSLPVDWTDFAESPTSAVDDVSDNNKDTAGAAPRHDTAVATAAVAPATGAAPASAPRLHPPPQPPSTPLSPASPLMLGISRLWTQAVAEAPSQQPPPLHSGASSSTTSSASPPPPPPRRRAVEVAFLPLRLAGPPVEPPAALRRAGPAALAAARFVPA
ncbi:hypothetical protein HK405_011213, partial [Cladochytrium tenue]